MKTIIITAIIFSIQGCATIFIPGFAIDAVHDKITGESGNHCVAESAKIGDRINIRGQDVGTIKMLYGTSYKCKSWNYPIRAKLDLN